MSTVTAEAPDGEQRAASAAVWQRRIALVLLVVALTALLRVETASIADDLLLTAPAEALPATVVPVRVHVLRHVDAPSGPALGAARVRVRIADLAGDELVWAMATGDAQLGLAARLVLPPTAQGTLRIDAWECQGDATHDARSAPAQGALRVSRALTIVRGATPTVLPREALPLQRAALGRLRVDAGEVPPSPFLPRVLGGVCIPEELCELAVWVGEPASSVALVAGAGVEIVRDFPSEAQAGLALATLRVHGPEADLTLRARRGEHAVASRTMRMPVALGRAYLGPISLENGLLKADYALSPGRIRGIVDVFTDGAWVASEDVTSARGRLALPIAPGTRGVVRVQLRGDAFSAEGAAARQTYVEAGGGGALQRGVQALFGEDDALFADDLPRAWADDLPHAIAGTPALALQFVAAAGEEDAFAVPAPVRARPALTAQMARGKLRVRWAFALAVLCAAVVVALALMRRGLGAAREAASVLAEEERPAAFRARLEVVLWALGVALAFAAAALLIVAKPLWF